MCGVHWSCIFSRSLLLAAFCSTITFIDDFLLALFLRYSTGCASKIFHTFASLGRLPVLCVLHSGVVGFLMARSIIRRLIC